MGVVKEKKGNKILNIFLSYAKIDEGYASKIEDILENHNLRIFTMRMLSAGGDWLNRLRDEISQSDLFIVLLSPNSFKSEWVLAELGAAWALRKDIIPIYTRPEMLSKSPIDLSKSESIDINYLEEHPEVLDRIIEKYKESITRNS
jgi:hypothetical protein